MPRIVVYAAGSNAQGQLAIGSLEDAHVFTRCPLETSVSATSDLKVTFATGANHTLLLLDDGERQDLFIAGSSVCGQLGESTDRPFLRFTPISLRQLLPLLPGDDYARLPATARNLRVSGIAAAWESSFLLLQDKRSSISRVILAMGSDEFGLRGAPTVKNQPCLMRVAPEHGFDSIVSGARHAILLDKSGKATGWGAARHGQLDPLNILSSLRMKAAPLSAFTGTKSYSQVAVGYQHTCLLSRDRRTVTVVGGNKKGQLGSPGRNDSSFSISRKKPFRSVHTTWGSTFLVCDTASGGNQIISFGNNGHGQLGRDDGARGFVKFDCQEPSISAISAGSEHVLALLERAGRRELWGWGWNEHGNLGRGEDLSDVQFPFKIRSDDTTGTMHAIHAGNGTSWIVTLEND